MGKVLKITKPDKTVHVVPVANKAFLQSYNNRMPQVQQWKIEEIDEKDAKDLPFIDETYLTPGEAVVKSAELEKTVAAKDEEIEKLKKELESKPAATPAMNAEMLISLIKVAPSIELIENLVKGDERKTVKDAAEKRIAELKA